MTATGICADPGEVLPKRRQEPADDGTFVTLSRICDQFSLDALRPLVAACGTMHAADGLVDVAVIGNFKAGKSSLLNRLVGCDVLPVDFLPATAVVTRVRQGQHQHATVHHLNGTQVTVPLEEVKSYATERENPNNVKQVISVEIELPMPTVLSGLRFVDTPGLGSAHAHNTRAVEDWLPQVGAAVVAVSVEHPLAEADIRLIEQLLPLTPEVVVLLTKVDLVSAEQLKEIKAFALSQLRTRLERDFPILSFCSVPGHDADNAEFLGFLEDRYAASPEAQTHAILNHKLDSLRRSCLEYLELARRAAQADATARARLSDEVRLEQTGMKQVDSAFRLIVQHLRTRAVSATQEALLPTHGAIATRLRADLEGHLSGWHGNLAHELNYFRVWLDEALERELGPVSDAHADSWKPLLDEGAAHVNRSVRAFKDRLAAQVIRTLGIPFSGVQFEARVSSPTRPDTAIGRTFDTPWDSIWFLVPMWLFRPLVRRHFRRIISWEVEKNLFRLAAQWSGAIDDSITAMVDEARGFMRVEQETILRLLTAGTNDLERIEKAIADILCLKSTNGRSATHAPADSL